jgi:hypothetical protein
LEKGCAYSVKALLTNLTKHSAKIDFDRQPWLRDLLFPHIDSEDMPEDLNVICKERHAQFKLEKQTTENELTNFVSLDVVKHCIHNYI